MSITQRIVIIGYGTAGWSASVSVQQTSRRAEITVFEKRPYALYHPCSLPEVIEGKFPINAIVSKAIPKSKCLRVFINTLVEEIDVESSKVVARNLKTGEKIAVEYDRLILALGSVPHIPSSIEIKCSEGIYSLKFIEDGVKSRELRENIVGQSSSAEELLE